MGTEAVWVPLALAAVSAGAAYVNTKQTARRQDNQLASQLRSEAAKQREADAKTAALIQSQQLSSDKPDKAKSLAGFQQQIALKAPAATASLNAPGAVSAAYEKSKSNAALGVSDYANKFADNVASIDAPIQQRQRDALTFGRYGTDINQIRRFNQGDDFLANMRLRAIKSNPNLDLLSGLSGAAAGAYGSGMGDAYNPVPAPKLVNNLPDLGLWGYAPNG